MANAVLFDLYGTLVDIKTDEEAPSLWRELGVWCAVHLGYEVSAEQLHHDYIRLCQEKAEIYGEGFVLPEVFRELLGGSVSEEDVDRFAQVFRSLSIRSFEIRPYTIPLLAGLRGEKLRLALVSNTEAILTKYDIDRLGIRSFFDAIMLSSDVGVAKPDPKILDKALHSISVTSRDAVFVGDTLETDVAAARALDMPCVLITNNPEKLTAFRGDMIRAVRPVLEDIYIEIKQLLNSSRC